MKNNILIIDTEKSNISYIKSYLKSKDLNFLEPETTEKINDFLIKNQISLILININTKSIDCLNFINSMKRNMKFSLIPIIIFGKNIQEHQKLKLISEGAYEVFELPFDVCLFDSKIRSAIILSESVTKFYFDKNAIEKDKSDFFYNERLKISKELSINLANQIKDHFNYILGSSVSILENDNITLIKDCAKKIHNYAKDAYNILNFMIEQTALEKANFQTTSIQSMIADVIVKIKTSIQNNSLCELKIFSNIKEQKIKIDSNHLSKALFNIIENACEAIFMRNDLNYQGVVEINGFIREKNYCISIKDNGIGIHKEMVTKIFNPFFSTKENKKGMGMTFARQIIENSHKGKFQIQSVNGKETIIEIIIPLN